MLLLTEYASNFVPQPKTIKPEDIIRWQPCHTMADDTVTRIGFAGKIQAHM